MSENKYKMFKNYMMNELGISREDIQNWIKESIKEEIKKHIKSTYETVNIESEIRKNVNNVLTDNWNSNRFKNEVYEAISKEVVKTHLVKLFPKE